MSDLQMAVADAEAPPASEKRGRGRTKPFPTCPFSDALELAQAIRDYGVGGRIRRTILFDKLRKSPDSGPSRQLVINAGKYGLTLGGYQAEFLQLTGPGAELLELGTASPNGRKTAFSLSIGGIEAFRKLYERLKDKRLQTSDVLRDELTGVEVNQTDRDQVVRLFLQNTRQLGLVRERDGAERLLSLEHLLEELGDVQPGKRPEVSEAPVREEPPPRRDIADEVRTFSPSVHIDIQIHIDANAAPEQIDQIFRSMRQHFYGNGVGD